MEQHHWYFYQDINDQICSSESAGLLKVRFGMCRNNITPRHTSAWRLFPYGEDYGGKE